MEVIVFVSFFSLIFGVIYLFFSTRHKERMALIEKGQSAAIFSRNPKRKAPPIWKVFILNFALLLMGIGGGILLATILASIFKFNTNAIYPACIFLSAGTMLFIGFRLTDKMDREMED